MNTEMHWYRALMRMYFEDKATIMGALEGVTVGKFGFDSGVFDSSSQKARIYSSRKAKTEGYEPVIPVPRLIKYSRVCDKASGGRGRSPSIWAGLYSLQRATNADLILNINRIQIESAIRNNTGKDLNGGEDYSAVARKISRFCKTDGLEIVEPVIVVAAALEEPNKSTVQEIGTWADYEKDCAKVLREAGYRVRLTSGGADYGADILCDKDDRTYVVQCKLFARSVGVKAVQEIMAARSHYKADFAVVCSESGFTSAAANLASSNETHLTNIAGLPKIEDAWA